MLVERIIGSLSLHTVIDITNFLLNVKGARTWKLIGAANAPQKKADDCSDELTWSAFASLSDRMGLYFVIARGR